MITPSTAFFHSLTSINSCEDHSFLGHLFKELLCSKQSLLQKICNVVFNILTFCIPLVVYKILSSKFPKTFDGKNGEVEIQTKTFYSVQHNLSDSKICEEAIQFALKKLGMHPPVKAQEKIAALKDIYDDFESQTFANALKNNPKGPWSKKEVVEAGDACMKIAYAISRLSLEEIPEFTKKFNIEKPGGCKGKNLTYARAIAWQDCDFSFWIYHNTCPRVYRSLRAGAIAQKSFSNMSFYYPQEDVSKTYSNLFYKSGTMQNSWNVLHNDYCERMLKLIPAEELSKADDRQLLVICKDTLQKPSYFHSSRDSY